MSNLVSETPRQQMVRTVQEELAGRCIHDGWKLKDIAQKAELSWSTVSNNFRRRVHRPAFSTIVALASVLDIELTFKNGKVYMDKGEMTIARRPRKSFVIGGRTFTLPLTEKEMRGHKRKRQLMASNATKRASRKGRKAIKAKRALRLRVVAGTEHRPAA